MIRQEKKDLKSLLQLKKQKNKALNYQSLSANTKNLLKRIKINMTKKKNREDIKKYDIPKQNINKFKQKTNKFKHKKSNLNYKHKKNDTPDTYISKLIDMYYNNDDVSKDYITTAHKQSHILPTQRRVIVFGDIHGDLEAAIDCFTIAGCINKIKLPTDKSVKNMNEFFKNLKWIGKDTYIVQLGDQIDRVRPQNWDNNEITRDNAYKDEGSTLEILYLFYYLNELAQKDEGRVYSIIGNHEIMNIEADFRYVSLKEFKCFKQHLIKTYKKNSQFPYQSTTLKNNSYKIKHTKKNNNHKNNHKDNNDSNNDNDKEFTNVPEGFRERLYAFSPTGLCANLIGKNNYVLLQIGNWLFCHGGPVVDTVKTYNIDLINNIVSMYLLGIDTNDKYIEKHYNIIAKSKNKNNILWSREFGETNIDDDKDTYLTKQLDNVLNEYNTKNSVMNKATHIAIGHTTQYSANKGINSICNDRVWRCDVGMSRAFGNRKTDSYRNPQVLEILNSDGEEKITILQ